MHSQATPKRDWPPSLWAHTAPPAPSNGALSGTVSMDVAIIGAGFTGLRAALHLSETGTQVAVLDATDVDWGASGKTGGQVVGQDDVTRLSGTAAYQSGIVNPRGGAIHPLMYVHGLAEAARQRGAQNFGGSAVTSLTKIKDRWRLTTATGQMDADWVIVGTNGYTDDLIPNLVETIIPISPVQIASAPLPPEVIDEILPEGHTISDSRRVIMYARREPDNRIVYGGHGETDKNGNLVGFDWLVKDAERGGAV